MPAESPEAERRILKTEINPAVLDYARTIKERRVTSIQVLVRNAVWIGSLEECARGIFLKEVDVYPPRRGPAQHGDAKPNVQQDDGGQRHLGSPSCDDGQHNRTRRDSNKCPYAGKYRRRNQGHRSWFICADAKASDEQGGTKHYGRHQPPELRASFCRLHLP